MAYIIIQHHTKLRHTPSQLAYPDTIHYTDFARKDSKFKTNWPVLQIKSQEDINVINICEMLNGTRLIEPRKSFLNELYFGHLNITWILSSTSPNEQYVHVRFSRGVYLPSSTCIGSVSQRSWPKFSVGFFHIILSAIVFLELGIQLKARQAWDFCLPFGDKLLWKCLLHF